MAEKKANAKKDAAKAPDKASPGTLDTEIRAAAQKVYEERQRRHLDGDELSDWLKAEADVKKRHKLS